jgi:hypothetical protein
MAGQRPYAEHLTETYLIRLRQSDPSKDWRALATPFPESMLYGEFMGLMDRCAPKEGPHPGDRSKDQD